VDIAAADMLAECHEDLAARGITLRLANLNGEIRDLVRRDELEQVFGVTGPGLGVENIVKGWRGDHPARSAPATPFSQG